MPPVQRRRRWPEERVGYRWVAGAGGRPEPANKARGCKEGDARASRWPEPCSGPMLCTPMEMREQLQQTLGNAYVLERELGGGGMSQVFVAEEVALGRKVVVKVLPPGRTGDVNIERFKREIQVAARLQHAHIVPVLTAGETKGLPYYTMPYVEGESLRARLARQGPLSFGETVNILRDVARALAYA